ncbi:hypothetical protein COE56_28880 [Bacillus anthracis]|nr:hypothetical protein COE56_28880 [Bacillus anthracis]
MSNWIVFVQAATPVIALLAAGTTLYNARSAKKAQENAATSEKNVKGIEERIEKETNKILESINDKTRIATIIEIRSKTEGFQKLITPYYVKPDDYDSLGLDINIVVSELGNYISIVKKNNWIFDGEQENYSDNLCNQLNLHFGRLGAGIESVEVHNIVMQLKLLLDTYHSMLNKSVNQKTFNA